MARLLKRVCNGILYTLLVGALLIGGITWLALISSGPWYVQILYAILAGLAFASGFAVKEGGADLEDKDEDGGV